MGLLVAVGKGLLFVIFSTGLVYALCRREYRNSERTMGLLRAVVEGTTDAVFVKDLNGRYQLVNAAAAQFIGRPVGEILGRDDRELFDANEAEKLIANDRTIMASNTALTQDETLTSSGVTRTYLATKAPYFDATGKVIGLIGISRNITDRALVESALRETDARLREAQRIAKLGSWSWIPYTDLVWWSDAEFELFGVTPSEVRPSFNAFLDLLHPDDREIAIARVQSMLDGADEFSNDLRVIHTDGTCTWISSQARATRDPSGKLIRVEGTDQDITAQRLARESVYESQRRLQAAVEVAGLGVIDVDYVRQSVELSTRAAEQFGFSPHTTISRSDLHSRFHPDDKAEIAKVIQEAVAPGGSGWFALEHRVVRPDGTTRWLNVRKQVLFDDTHPKRAIVVTADVTEQREAQSRLREQEMLVREAAELAKVGGWGFDPVTLESDWTPTVSEMYGVPHDSPPPMEIALDYFSPEQRPALIKALDAAMKDGVPHDMELQLTATNGEQKWVRTICRPIIENGRVVRVRGSLQDITDRKRAESELRASEERYRLLFESNPHPMWVYDVDTLKFLAVNDAAVQAYGYSRQEFLAMTIRDIRPADEVTKLEQNISRTMRGLSRSTQWKHRRKDGTIFDVEISSHDLPEEQGHSRLVLALDITDRKRAESAREVATQRLSKFASQLPGAIFLYRLGADDKSTIPYASEKIETILGTRHDLLNIDENDTWANVYFEDRDDLLKSIRNSATSLTPLSKEFRVVNADGTWRWISCDAVPEREPNGSTLWHGYMKEVTETHEAAIALQEAKTRLEEAQALARVGSWSYDVVTDTHQWSKQMYKIFGLEFSNAQPDYQKMLASFYPEDAVKLDAFVKIAISEGTPYSLDVRIQQPQSDVRFVRCEGRSRRDATGKIVGLYGTSADVTAEVEREQALKDARVQADAANRAKSEFLANMSHEIRTPLTAILGFAEVLRDDIHFAAPQHWIHDLDTIASAGKHLLSIINDILDLSKIEADKSTLELIETPLIEVLSEVERLLRSTASGKGVILSTKLSSPIPDRFLCDPTRLRQILMNLVGNAVKFTEAGTIVIHASVASPMGNNSLIIDIEDTGRGIDMEQSQSLFQAFEQADNTVSRKHGGTGLGLTISRRLAVLMGGDVTLVWTELGRGSCFRLTLPMIPVAGAVLVNSIQATTVSDAGVTPEKVSIRGRILLAEDGLDNQRLIAFLLKKAGAVVDVADDGQIALQMMESANASNTPYDLLLTDMQMPVMDGYMLAKTLRSQGSKIPIVALTAHALAEDRQKCLDAGCDDYLSKPVDKHSLLIACSKWIAT
jgi:PAS domain S-box-containing protein